MNTLQGIISEIRTEQSLSLVRIDVKGILMSAIVIDTPDTLDYLKVGTVVKVIFKETEVIIGKGYEHPISLRNRFEGVISHIEKGGLLAKVVVETSVGLITSIITSNAVNTLGLEIGSDVTAMIKTNEIMLSA